MKWKSKRSEWPVEITLTTLVMVTSWGKFKDVNRLLARVKIDM